MALLEHSAGAIRRFSPTHRYTLTVLVQDWLRDNRPSDYAHASYTCIEISPQLAARQYEHVVAQGGHAGR
jgi:SAM-dependent MidA family methyltransferase